MPNIFQRAIALLLLLAGLFATGQVTAQEWQWASHEGGPATESGRKVAVDASGNSFVAATFTGTLSIGGNSFTASNTDVVLAKYDLSGKLIWAKQLGSSLNDDVTSITPDRNGGVLIAGNFAGATLNYNATGILTNASAGSMDVYLLRLDGNGNLAWSFSPVGLGNDLAGKTYSDGKSVLLSGHTLSLNIQFGAKPAIANPSFDPAFLCSLDLATGAVNWGRLFGNGYRDYGDGVVFDKSGNAYMGGMFSSNTLKLDAITLTNANTNKTFDIFIAKFDLNGQCLWAKTAAGTADDVLTGLAIDDLGNLYFSGGFSSATLNCDGKNLTNGIGLEQMVVGSLDGNGNARWLMRPSPEVQGRGTDISAAGSDIYVSGYYRGGSMTLNSTMSNAGMADGFVAQFNSAGTVVWNDRFGGANDEMAYGVAATSCGAVMTGEFSSSTVSFGAIVLKNPSAGQPDIAVASLARKSGFSVPHTKSACGPSVTLDAGAGYATYLWVTGEKTQTINVTSSGIYPVRVLDASGCYGVDSTQVSIVNADVMNVDATVCKGTPVKLWVDTSAQSGTLIRHFTHDMSSVWSETFSTINQGRYRLVVSGDWQPINMVGFRLDPANQYSTSTGAFNQKWNGSHTPASFLVNGNAIRPFNDVYQPTHVYEYQFQASSDQTIINYVNGFLTESNGTLVFDLYRINDPVTVSWAPTGEKTNLVNVTPAATTTYTATLTDGTATCSDKVVITVTPDNTVALSTAVGTDAQITCVNNPIVPIGYTTTGATGFVINGLPPGMSGALSGSTVTISGTSAAAGDYPYTLKLTGGCGTVSTTGKINVILSNTISLTSAVGTDNQNRCVNIPITPITYATTGATGATFSKLPTGVTGDWTANVVTIKGTPSTPGKYDYVITLLGGCGTVTQTGTINVIGDNTIKLSSAVGSDAPTICINRPATDITWATTGATGGGVVGLPTGMSGSWAANVFTVTGTPTVSGSFNYTVTLTGGCASVAAHGVVTVNPDNTVSLTSGAGSDAQISCINTPIKTITYATTGATGTTVTGLPSGVTASWAANVLTISGTPTVSGNATYTVTLNGGCGIIQTTGYINVKPDNTITLGSVSGSDAQSTCLNTPITNIIYNTTGATGATVSGLPAGVNFDFMTGVVTISGTPTQTGSFPYLITLTGGCGVVTKAGSITVNLNSITLTSAVSTENQSLCLNSAITPINYTTTGAIGANVTGLPAGVTANWASDKLTISGTATASGNFPYLITLTGGCGIITRSGTLNVTSGNTITLTSASGTDAQAICLNTPLTTVTYATTGATNATVTGLPAGVSGKWIANTVTISGTPTAAGSYPYSITLTGGCGNVTATGTLVVTASNTIVLSSATGTNAQVTCQNSAIQPIIYNTVGATGATVDGLPAGVTANWSLNVLTISGTPTTAGNANYTITLTGGCGTVTEKGSIKVNPIAPASVTIATAMTSVCAGSPVTFTATPVNPGTTPGYRWQVNFTDVFLGNPVFTTANLKDGDLVCVVMNSNAQCVVASPAESNIIRMQVNTVPSITATTGASNCGPGSITLNATASTGNVNWYAAATGGTLLTTGNAFTTPAITSTTTYYAEASSLGCVSPTRTPVEATVNAIPKPSIVAAAGPELCINSEVNYTTQSGMSGYTWTVPGVAGTDYVIKAGGLGATDNSVTIDWITTGGRQMEVNYTDAHGCVGAAAKTNLYVHALPYGSISAPADLSLCKGDAITLTATGGATYTWYRNGVADLLNTGSTYAAKEEGIYTAQLVSAVGCKAPALGSATISFKALPVPSFTVVPACAGSATEFINGTTYGGPGTLSFNWDLDDGNKAITTDATQIYMKGGSKKIFLSATSSTCPNAPVTATALVTITSSRPAMHVGPVDAVAGKPVTLQARSFGQHYTWTPASGLSDPTSDRTDATLNKDATYTVSIMDAGGCVTVDTVSVRVFPGSRIYVPTAFTPNGDGLNDKLFPVLAGYKGLSFFRIYDRFGNLVYQTDKADKDHGWDGRYKGYDQPTGTFIWALRVVEENGTVVDKSGSFTLIR